MKTPTNNLHDDNARYRIARCVQLALLVIRKKIKYLPSPKLKLTF